MWKSALKHTRIFKSHPLSFANINMVIERAQWGILQKFDGISLGMPFNIKKIDWKVEVWEYCTTRYKMEVLKNVEDLTTFCSFLEKNVWFHVILIWQSSSKLYIPRVPRSELHLVFLSILMPILKYTLCLFPFKHSRCDLPLYINLNHAIQSFFPSKINTLNRHNT